MQQTDSARRRVTMRTRVGIFAGIGGMLIALFASVGVLSASASDGNADNVTLCHRTDDVKMPYVVITIDQNGIDNINTGPNGHGTHTGPLVTSEAEAQALKDQKIMWGDIIPAFNIGGVNFPGLNNTPAGLAILANGCNFVTPVTPTTGPPETTAPPETKAPPVTTAPKAPTPPVQVPSAPTPVVQVPRVTG